MEYSSGDLQAEHLCVLVHGLWGNPSHMVSIADFLRSKHPDDKLRILVAKANTGRFTYDGIDRGGERVCAEIEAEVQRIREAGGNVRRFSLVGYSLGGLIIRYTAGLLQANGFLDTVECMNFVTFASPHLGSRTPSKGIHSDIWNGLGARVLSISGRQLFTIDDFRGTGKPLLSVLADRSSVFVAGLKRFKKRVLYSNIANDRTAVFYTTCISRTDPYVDMERIAPRFVPGYGRVVLDPVMPFDPTPVTPVPKPLSVRAARILRLAPIFAGLALIIPVGVVVFLVAAAYHTLLSSKRIRLYELGQGGVTLDKYRPALWIEEMRSEVDHVYDTLSGAQGESYLESEGSADESSGLMHHKRRNSSPVHPTLALSPEQFKMIDAMDEVGWTKYPVWIRNDMHTHAAIIVRFDKPSFEEGKMVLSHFVEEAFEI
ncbi:hypothetical protein TD95_001188 [Thielaviopsis punctulata]|uniref:DUF676 domain-containing protein n=1 Tax=Thielaviopsis punctulata TaxID=72032 RepID=A0A0F4ZDH1_9PEZI|nr:hypothetical protein TD95_001188 [Thielaviopsis punctulata]